ncbi:MAG: type II toxin-antitoxin system RelB/DinJ family antitoxin [Verrucomicrobiota bacterium]
MARTANIHINIDAGLKDTTERILKRMGVSMSDAIHLFLQRVKTSKYALWSGENFNDETRRTIQKAAKGVGLTKYKNTKALFKDLGLYEATRRHK